MTTPDFSHSNVCAPRERSGVNRDVLPMSSGLLLLLDLACLLLAAALSTSLYGHWFAPPAPGSGVGQPFGPTALVMAVLAPIMLYDPRFGDHAHRGLMSSLLRSHALRLTLFAGLVLTLGALGGALTGFTREWLVLWFCIALLLTVLMRLSGGRFLRHLHSQGRLSEVIAIVGAGAVAGQLVRSLRQSRPDTIQLLGIFDDEPAGAAPGPGQPTGTVEQLLELGKTSQVDWILLALPVAAEHRIPALVQRLKALSAPIGLCSAHGLNLPSRNVRYIGNGVPVSVLTDHPPRRWDALASGAEQILPRWTITLALLPLRGIDALAVRLGVAAAP